jgi:3-oxoacyl-[acyl-carrier protein] reductase
MVKADIANIAQMQAMVTAVQQELAPVDVLINNAGVFPRVPFLEMTEGDWDHVLDVNLKGACFCAQAIAKAMVEANRPGVRVNAIAPGLTDTAQPRYGSSEADLAEAARAIPLGRMARPEEVARAGVFLASEDAGFVTGQTLHVNGGSYFG